jgi:hypothetical protein
MSKMQDIFNMKSSGQDETDGTDGVDGDGYCIVILTK